MTWVARSAAPLAAGALLLLACRTQGPPAPSSGVVARRIAESLPEQWRNGSRVLAVTALLCLRCKHVGLLVRALRADSSTGLVVAVPATDRAPVIDYLQREKAVVPVVPLDPATFGSPLFTDSLMLVFVEQSGAPFHLVAPDGDGMLRMLRDRVPPRPQPVVVRGPTSARE